VTSNSEHRVKFLDTWRFIAVWLVIQSHLLIYSGLSIIDKFEFLRRLGRFGTLGVSIFFFLSGYVICTGLLIEYGRSQRVSLLAFYVRRFFRINPPRVLFLFSCYFLSRFGLIKISISQLSLSALYLCNLNFDCSWYAGHTWSLAYEEQFYLIFPLLFIWLYWKLKSRLFFFYLLIVLILVSLIFRVTGHDFFSDYPHFMSMILTGVVVALFKNELSQKLHNISSKLWVIVACIFVVFIIFTPYYLEKYTSILFYPPIIAYLVFTTPVHHKIFQILFENHYICYLGRITYTVYLWQQLAMAKYDHLPLFWYPIMLIAVWIWAHLSFKWFESPLIYYASGLSRLIKDRSLMKYKDNF
jgi:peptidoglycan/LPS O-acetylase OafA/YrhL